MKLTIISLFIALLLISGCVATSQKEIAATPSPDKDIIGNRSEPASGQDIAATPSPDKEIIGNKSGPASKQDIAATLSPARDITGTWSGPASWQDNVGNPICSYEGAFQFNLEQNGNNIAGNTQMTIIKAKKLLQDAPLPCIPLGTYPKAIDSGTMSSSSFEFKAGLAKFTGTLTADLIKGIFESCPDQACSDGSPGVGLIGDFSATRQDIV